MATLIIVRRDAGVTFQHLEATWVPTLGRDLTLMWDRRMGDRRHLDAATPIERRVGERRAPDAQVLDGFREGRRDERRQQPEWRLPERRHGDRRRRAPDTWDTLGFLVVRSGDGPP
jgi:hypothetical protein